MVHINEERCNPEINTRDLEAKIDKRFNKILKKNLRTGIAVALYKNDTILIKNYGLKDKESVEAVDTSTIFEIGSITKIFTTSFITNDS